MTLVKTQLCLCGCGSRTKHPKANYLHGHHLRLKKYQGLSRKPDIWNQCFECGKSFVAPVHRKVQRFCSVKCCMDAKSKSIFLNCLQCGVKIRTIPSNRTRKKYCSRVCKGKFNRTHYRTIAYEKYGEVCQKCGYHEYPQILVVHHKDGDHGNGVIENLTVLCPTCHAVAHLFLGNLRLGPTARTRWRPRKK